VLALLPILFAAPDLTREQKLEQWKNFTLAASTLWAGVIVMNGVEDYAAKRGSDAANVQQGGPPPPGTFTPIITPAPPPRTP
jgi:hypothetical protein